MQTAGTDFTETGELGGDRFDEAGALMGLKRLGGRHYGVELVVAELDRRHGHAAAGGRSDGAGAGALRRRLARNADSSSSLMRRDR